MAEEASKRSVKRKANYCHRVSAARMQEMNPEKLAASESRSVGPTPYHKISASSDPPLQSVSPPLQSNSPPLQANNLPLQSVIPHTAVRQPPHCSPTAPHCSPTAPHCSPSAPPLQSVSLQNLLTSLNRRAGHKATHKKGVHVDGHERQDMQDAITYRRGYPDMLKQLYDTHLPPPLTADELVLVSPPDAEFRKNLILM